MTVACLFALVFVVAGCTADTSSPSPGDDTSETSEEIEITTEWEPPADPEEQGPTEAPVLPEEEAVLDAPIALSTEMVVALDAITTTTITPETPGEFAGTAVVVTVSLDNSSDRAQSIDSAVISLVTDDGQVGIGTTAGPNEPLQGELAAGETAIGTYVFMLDDAIGRSVKISVNYAAGEPVANFTGQIS
ncbi:hypothetical protein [Microbacterium sp. A94]|uniref:hypothetical protein n=1 Tax=Microbacterium sp. A94 TaxID=3450717 RepID=UPI003F43E6E0